MWGQPAVPCMRAGMCSQPSCLPAVLSVTLGIWADQHVRLMLQDQADEVTSKREARTLAHYIFWNVIPDYRG